MARIRPFRALHPVPERAGEVASVPYDVVSTSEAKALAEGNADSFLHVIRPEVDLPDGADSHAQAVYELGRDNLAAMRARGTLVVDDAPCVYVYRLEWQGQSQTGIVAGYSVEEYDRNQIKKHELTRPDKEEDRTTHILTLGAQPGPVFLTFRPQADVRALVTDVSAGTPWIDFTAPDGVRHTLWRVTDTGPWLSAFEQVDPVYVADGHHRSASASNVRRKLAGDGELPAEHPAHSFLAVAFPSDQVRILPYNRLVKDMGGMSADDLLAKLRETTGVTEADDGESTGTGDIRMYLAGRWYRIDLRTESDDPVETLCAQMLQTQVFEALLGLGDPRTEPRLAFVGGIRGTDELERRVDAGEGACAFSLAAVTPDQLLAVADADRTMPPKSTWFEPKLRSGLFTYLLEGS